MRDIASRTRRRPKALGRRRSGRLGDLYEQYQRSLVLAPVSAIPSDPM